MLCDNCKRNEANIKFTEIINNKAIEMNLCEECARAKGMHLPFEQGHFSLADLLSGLSSLGELPLTRQKGHACLQCGSTYEDFKNTGHLGCGRCYETFQKELTPLLKRLHGYAHHVGKVSPETSEKRRKEETIEKLRKELEEAVKKEEYERAAVIRDQIKEIEKEKKQQ